MTDKSCFGIDAATRRAVAIRFGRTLREVEDLVRGGEDLPWVAPGWIDLQVNGFAGVDFNAPDAPHDEIARAIRVLFSTGVTRFYPTVITGPEQAMTGALRNLAEARDSLPEGRAIEGFHVEGPHISPEDGPRGAHPREWVRPPSVEEYRRWQEAARGGVRLVTVAPEIPGALPYIEALAAEGIVVSIGHTGASSAEIADAVRAGAVMSTHLGNGAHAVMRRHPNYIWDQLAEDRLAAGFIVDGIHLPASFVKAAIRAKGTERSILVTDAVMPAGCRPGRYRLGTIEVDLHPDDRVTLAGENRLAGSALRMDRAIANTVRFAAVSMAEAVAMATRNPARVGRIAGRQKGLNPGERADLVEFRFDSEAGRITVTGTWVDGERVYEGPATA